MTQDQTKDFQLSVKGSILYMLRRISETILDAVRALSRLITGNNLRIQQAIVVKCNGFK